MHLYSLVDMFDSGMYMIPHGLTIDRGSLNLGYERVFQPSAIEKIILWPVAVVEVYICVVGISAFVLHICKAIIMKMLSKENLCFSRQKWYSLCSLRRGSININSFCKHAEEAEN